MRTKRFFSKTALLVSMLVFALSLVPIQAATFIGTAEQKSIINNIPNCTINTQTNVITITGDCMMSTAITLEKAEYVLDLNGYTLTSAKPAVL